VRSLERPGDAAVHRQRDATDMAGFVGDQPGDGVGDVAGLDPRGITAASIVDLYPGPDLAFRLQVDTGGAADSTQSVNPGPRWQRPQPSPASAARLVRFDNEPSGEM
jgi:hypothetical protein